MRKVVARSWQIFKKTPPGKLIRWLSPQWLVNLLEHYPVAVIANIRYGFPSQKIKVIGVTGTDGKTTTVNMIYRVLSDAGKKVSMVSTINAIIGDKSYETGFHVTSPHSFSIQEFLKKAVRAGSEYIVLEVTSHSLDQHRFFGVNFDIGVVTNVTHEHLDYHKTFENYLAAKAKLIKGVKFAVLNYDDPNFQKLSKQTSGKVISFGFSKDAQVNKTKIPLNLKIPGDFNIYNGLAASAVAQIVGIEKGVIQKSLSQFGSLPGRMEEVKNSKGIKIYVDFAHTPNGLTNALKAVKKQTKGKLISIIGCEGYRDVEKRPQMGKISTTLADLTIITACDPRGMLDKINQQILKGCVGEVGKNIFIEDDRSKAVKLAIKLAKKGDSIGIFGKGHETTMNLDNKKEIPYSDKEAVIKALKNG